MKNKYLGTIDYNNSLKSFGFRNILTSEKTCLNCYRKGSHFCETCKYGLRLGTDDNFQEN